MDWNDYSRVYEAHAVNIEYARQGFAQWHEYAFGNLGIGNIPEAVRCVLNAQAELYRMVYLRGLQLDLTKDYLRDLVPGEAPALTDAEIFDACYRELVKRWGPAGVT